MTAATIERRLFEVLGGWVPSVDAPEAKLLLRSHSFQHAWHAELWESLGQDTAEAAGLAADVEDMAVATATGSAERLAAVYEGVLPRLVGAYRAARDSTSALTNGPLVRVLDLCLADEKAAIREGLRVLRTLADAAVTGDST